VSVLLRTKGELVRKDIIYIDPTKHKNYVNIQCANQLFTHESNIFEKINSWKEKKNGIRNLQLNIGDYTFVSQFVVISLCDDNDIILGLP